MTEQECLAIDDTGWEVPGFDAALYAEKKHRHALVIPVIDEGERIRSQLLRIQAARLPVDVIVADGGSTDGSLDGGYVRSVDVRAVLTKTGPGKLSAQLRMAYAWCIRQGYDGIVTIDGNGKDGVQAVADMVLKLEEGCDYVQGSRYLPGGKAENTPLERAIANRLIHAPLLSLAGRHFFTDTTNGFRAYSTRYLTHPGVRPFRDEFQVYGLLFYLTVRAGQLGLKVDHVPVVRRYPDSGKVPTKIGGLAPKLALLGETVFAATGGHTPDAFAPRNPPLVWPLLATLLVTLPLFASVWVQPRYSPDSWAFYELAQTVFDDFYRFTHFRSYADPSPYSSAFPPLFPALIAIVDELLGTGPRTGLYLGFGFFVGFALLSEHIGRRVTDAAWFGLSVALLLLLGPNMLLPELAAGRTIPLQLLLYALVLLGLLQGKRITLASAAGIGFMAGLAILNRFDAVLLPIFSAGLIWWLTRNPARAIAALAGATIAVSPWIAYSVTTFSVFFATDNSGIATSLDPDAFVTDWWPVAQPTLAADPSAWLGRMAGNLGEFFKTGAALMVSLMGLVFILAVAVIASLRYLASFRPHAALGIGVAPNRLRIVSAFALIAATMMAPQILTGYLEHRYFAALFWVVFLAIGGWTIASGSSIHQRLVFGRIAFLVTACATLPFSALQVAQASQSGQFDFGNWSRFDAPEDVRRLQRCLRHDPASRILVLGDDNFAAKAGALGGLSTMMEPRNKIEGRLGPSDSRSFIEAWSIDYVLLKDSEREEFAMTTLNLVEAEDCPKKLYRVVQ